MDKRIIAEYERIIFLCQKRGVNACLEKELPYGIQLKIFSGKNSILLNIYFSKKKGLSHVIGGRNDNPLKQLLLQLLIKESDDTSWKTWIGTDESGKGDFFGPLVVVGFYCNKTIINDLFTLGVKDSKRLSDSSIKKIAKNLWKKYPSNIKIIELNPPKYNQLYQRFTERGKKLNQMLAWMHARIIVDMQKKFKSDGIIIDKFTNSKVMNSALSEFRNINYILRVKAESNLAVAAASILARANYLKKMEYFGEKYKMELPKGASKKVDDFVKKFVSCFGIKELYYVSKIHFKTYNKIEL